MSLGLTCEIILMASKFQLLIITLTTIIMLLLYTFDIQITCPSHNPKLLPSSSSSSSPLDIASDI